MKSNTQINISGHHIDLTEALKNYVTEKLDRLNRHVDSINSINVILSVEKLIQKAEAVVRMKGGELFANAESADLYAAIDALSDKLNRQLIKHKEKQQQR